MSLRKQKIIKCSYCGKDAIHPKETRSGKIDGKKFTVHVHGWPQAQGESCLVRMQNSAQKQHKKITF